MRDDVGVALQARVRKSAGARGTGRVARRALRLLRDLEEASQALAFLVCAVNDERARLGVALQAVRPESAVATFAGVMAGLARDGRTIVVEAVFAHAGVRYGVYLTVV